MWNAIEALTSKPSEIKFVKHNAVPIGADRMDTYGIQDPDSGAIGLYQSADKKTVYIAPADNCDNVMYAPVDSSNLFCAFAPADLGLSNSLQTISFDNLNTSRVTNMAAMFMICRALTSLNLEGLDTSNVTNMASMFAYCESLTSLDLSKLDTSKVTTMNSMFAYCYALTSLNLSNLNTSNVADYGMNCMFHKCSALTELDLSSFDTSNVTGMTEMFNGCENLERIYVGRRFVTNKVTEPADTMFGWCGRLKGEKGTTYGWDKRDITYARIDGGTSAPVIFGQPSAHRALPIP